MGVVRRQNEVAARLARQRLKQPLRLMGIRAQPGRYGRFAFAPVKVDRRSRRQPPHGVKRCGMERVEPLLCQIGSKVYARNGRHDRHTCKNCGQYLG